MGMHDDIPKDELFETIVKKYNKDILEKALEMVDDFQHWQAKRHGVDLSEFDKQFAKETRSIDMRCFEPEMAFFSSSMVRIKEDKDGR